MDSSTGFWGIPELGTIPARPDKFPSGKERKTQLKIGKKPLLQLK
jgi:hypothetical protein